MGGPRAPEAKSENPLNSILRCRIRTGGEDSNVSGFRLLHPETLVAHVALFSAVPNVRRLAGLSLIMGVDCTLGSELSAGLIQERDH
jgi:hypothetical protein